MICQAKKHLIIFMLLLVPAVMCSCSYLSVDSTETRMAFLESDSGRHYDIGTYITAGTADFISSEICAIHPDETDVTDENLTAKALIQIDITNNQASAVKNIYEKIYPASTTKLLTALMILKYADLDETAAALADDGGIEIPGARLCGFLEGDRITFDVLLNCILIHSGNDACVIAAEAISGTEEEFVRLMNKEAALIGAVDTHFVNSHGLHDEEHYTTAYDLYLIFMECLKYEQFRTIIGRSEYNALYKDKNNEPQSMFFENSNYYMTGEAETPDGVKILGGKTGSTGYAGECLIVFAEKESEDGTKTQYITGVFHALTKDSMYGQISYLLEGK